MRLRYPEKGPRNLGQPPSPASRRQRQLPIDDGVLRRAEAEAVAEGHAGIESAVEGGGEMVLGAVPDKPFIF